MSFASEMAALLDIPQESVIGDADMQQIYTCGYQLYETGNYERATQFFTKLISCNPFMEKYWHALASSLQMQKNYRGAVKAWSLVALFAGDDPMPHFHAAECLFSLREKEEALHALRAAEELAIQNDHYFVLRDKIHVLKEAHGNEL
ncbi:MAG TPA: SycD/LcrH family type III secretion system chaperone [Rhabdochlamydiaceae bacterium]|jgi:type III secretion system low calcium response chaperone LcrH/SycD